jgi:4-diphosphocytidyl-2-C-methyl-D-erythritol kinase
MGKVKINSFCKVNIGLQIQGKRSDGYHKIHTLYQCLDFHDSITLEKTNDGCEFVSNVGWLKKDESNLCIKAINSLRNHFEFGGVSITLQKRIPAGAGLGGGSSNAASILKGVSDLYNLDLKEKELEKIGVELGADVPFFIRGGLQIGNGIGERLEPLGKSVSGIFLLVVPPIHIDTKWAYSNSKLILEQEKEKINFASFIQEKVISFELFENDFETIVVPTYPEIGEIKETLRANGARFASLSGSGSTVYGIFDDDASANVARSNLSEKYKTFIAFPSP